MLASQEPPVPEFVVNGAALDWHGLIFDFERLKLLDRDPHEIYELMRSLMREDVERLVPRLVGWLCQLCPEEVRAGRGYRPNE